jgi:hypothetical protein
LGGGGRGEDFLRSKVVDIGKDFWHLVEVLGHGAWSSLGLCSTLGNIGGGGGGNALLVHIFTREFTVFFDFVSMKESLV